MALLEFDNLNQVPPGGWEFYQPEIGWHAPNPVQDGFWTLVNKIVALRKNNPRFNLPTNPEIVALEVQRFNCPKVPKRCRSSQPEENGRVVETKRRKGCSGCGR